MQDDIAISIKQLNKAYKLYNSPKDRMKEALHPLRKKYHHDFYALDDICLDVTKGETLGIIGKNGSGKSTLLKIITGVLTPTSGSVDINGRISALLELGAGFSPELSGIENIYFNGTIMGYTTDEINSKLDDILAFADIGEFIYQPVKTYSSGMFVRLAFAVAINVEPEILIVDEALSVGDLRFQAKCFKKIEQLQKKGTTILFVSHDLGTVRAYCTKAILLDQGKIIDFGNTDDVCTKFHLKIRAEQVKEEEKNPAVNKDILNDTSGEIVSVAFFDEQDNELDTFEAGSMLTAKITVKAYEEIMHPAVSVSLQNMQGINLLGMTTFYQNFPVTKLENGEIRVFEFKFKLSLNAGSFLVTSGFADQTDFDVVRILDNFDKGVLHVFNRKKSYGLYIPEQANIKYYSQRNDLPMSSETKVTVGENQIKLYLSDRHERNYFECANGKDTDFDILVAQHFIHKEDIVLDAGANIGFSSLIFLKYGAGKVYAFEPVPYLYQRLLELETSKVEKFDFALSDVNETTEILLSSSHNQGHTLNPDFLKIFPSVFGTTPERTTVNTVSLDSFLPDINFDFIKVDIEGSEMKFLRGASKKLSSAPPRIMMIEIYNEVFDKVNRECSRYFKYSKRVAICPNSNTLKLFKADENEEHLRGYRSGPPIYLYSNSPIEV